MHPVVSFDLLLLGQLSSSCIKSPDLSNLLHRSVELYQIFGAPWGNPRSRLTQTQFLELAFAGLCIGSRAKPAGSLRSENLSFLLSYEFHRSYQSGWN